MGHTIPKQFIEIQNKPLLMWTIEFFNKCKISKPYIIVLPENYFDLWKELCNKYNFEFPHRLVAGGKTRFESVFNGLKEIEDNNSIIAIHDGARPFVSTKVVEKAFEIAEQEGNAVPVVKITDSVRIIENNNSSIFPRESLRSVQTPQVFKAKIIIQAYNQRYIPIFTDDASVVEYAGYKINLIDGNTENIKITTKSDLAIANAMLKFFPFI